jgi:hypothetical protein
MEDEYLTPDKFDDILVRIVNCDTDNANYIAIRAAYRILYDEFIGGEEDELPI